MTTSTTATRSNQQPAGFPPAPPEAHQRADRDTKIANLVAGDRNKTWRLGQNRGVGRVNFNTGILPVYPQRPNPLQESSMSVIHPLDEQAGSHPYSKRFAVSQTVASARLEGYTASQALIADLEAIATGERTADDVVASFRARALARLETKG